MMLRTGIELADDEVSGGAQGVLHFLCVGFRDGEHQEKLAVAASLLVTLLISCWFEYLQLAAPCACFVSICLGSLLESMNMSAMFT